MRPFPQLAMGFERQIGMGFQLRDQTGLQGSILLGRTPGNGLGAKIPGFSSLFEVTFDGGERDPKHLHNLDTWVALVHRFEHVLS